MTRKLHKILAAFGIGSVTLFQAGGGWDYLAEQFMQGVELGYQMETGESLFGTSFEDDVYWDDTSYVDYSDGDYGGDVW